MKRLLFIPLLLMAGFLRAEGELPTIQNVHIMNNDQILNALIRIGNNISSPTLPASNIAVSSNDVNVGTATRLNFQGSGLGGITYFSTNITITITGSAGGGGGGDPTVITTFTHTFRVPGDISISTFTFDPMGTGWDIGNATMTIIRARFKCESSSVGSVSAGLLVATGTAQGVNSSIYTSSWTAPQGSINYEMTQSSWQAPTTQVINPGSRLAVHLSNAPASGQAPRNGELQIEYYYTKPQ